MRHVFLGCLGTERVINHSFVRVVGRQAIGILKHEDCANEIGVKGQDERHLEGVIWRKSTPPHAARGLFVSDLEKHIWFIWIEANKNISQFCVKGGFIPYNEKEAICGTEFETQSLSALRKP